MKKNIFDNKIFQMLEKIIDCIYSSILWFIFSLPLITAGASTTALYYTVNKVIRYDRGNMSKEFFKAFKSNFRQSTLV